MSKTYLEAKSKKHFSSPIQMPILKLENLNIDVWPQRLDLENHFLQNENYAL